MSMRTQVYVRGVSLTSLPVAGTVNDSMWALANLQGIPLVQQADLEAGKDGVSTQPAARLRYNSAAAYEASKIVKNTAGTLFHLSGYNSKGSAQWIQIFDNNAVSGTPIFTATVPATSNFSFAFPDGLPCTTGISIGNSTTGPTLTAGAADCYFTVLYL
jgi:hypothetical protein